MKLIIHFNNFKIYDFHAFSRTTATLPLQRVFANNIRKREVHFIIFVVHFDRPKTGLFSQKEEGDVIYPLF